VSDTHAAYKNRFLSTQSVFGFTNSRGYSVFCDEFAGGTLEKEFNGRRLFFIPFFSPHFTPTRYPPIFSLVCCLTQKKKEREKSFQFGHWSFFIPPKFGRFGGFILPFFGEAITQ
jgi:hypothetical protein